MTGSKASTACYHTPFLFTGSGSDDDLGAKRSNSKFDSRVSVLNQILNQHLVEFREEDSISNELSLFADLI